jgi:hypothetical protein
MATEPTIMSTTKLGMTFITIIAMAHLIDSQCRDTQDCRTTTSAGGGRWIMPIDERALCTVVGSMAARARSRYPPDRIHLVGHRADGIYPNPHNMLACTNLDLLSPALVCHANLDYGPDVELLRQPRLPHASLNCPHSGLP